MLISVTLYDVGTRKIIEVLPEYKEVPSIYKIRIAAQLDGMD